MADRFPTAEERWPRQGEQIKSYKVVANYLKDEDFTFIKNQFFGDEFAWYHNSNITNYGETIGNFYYQIHILYDNNRPNSNYFDPIIEKFDFFNGLFRVKVNMYPNQGKFIEHPLHKDYEFEHKGALFCLNNCDGYTKIDDDKIKSVANRMIFFDPTKPHASTNTTNKDRRVNINFNYF